MPRTLQLRGGHVESVHPFSAVVVSPEGAVARVGEAFPCPMRSAAKPFQLACSLEALGDPELPEEELAVGTASHTAEPVHVSWVRSVLRRFEVPEAELACGAHPPALASAYAELLRSGGEVSDIHNNCSGKHAFMLAASAAQGWTGDYRAPEHPLQRRIQGLMERLSGEPVRYGIDGCGVPSWVLSLDGMARSWLALATGEEPRLARIAEVMMAQPLLISGSDRLDYAIARGRRERIAVKIGAQALYCMAFPDRRLAMVIKVHSGSEAALGPAVVALMERFVPGAWAAPADWDRHTLRNVVGRPVGEYRVELQ